MTRYLDAGSLPGYASRAEGDSLWDFRLDALDVELDMSVLPVLGCDVYTVGTLEKSASDLYDDDRKIFGGAVTHVAYDYNTETLSLSLGSYGKIVSDIEMTNFKGTDAPMAGIIGGWMLAVNQALGDWPFRLSVPYVDVEDFIFYRSLQVSSTQPGPRNFSPYTGVDNIKGLVVNRKSGPYYGQYFLQYGIDPSVANAVFLVPVDENGADDTRYYTAGTSLLEYDPDLANDPVPNGLLETINAAENFSYPIYSGQAKIREGLYYLYATDGANRYLIRAEMKDDDRYSYNYEAARAGEVLRDIAMMTNSVAWIGPDGGVYLQGRNGRGALPVVSAREMSGEYIQRDDTFSVPEAFFVVDSVRENLESYYRSYINGRFYRARVTVDNDAFDVSEYPLMLKNLKVNILGRTVDAGIIRAVEHGENGMIIETERRDG